MEDNMYEQRIKNRNSNLELLRIVLMFLVVAHHCVTASGIQNLYDLTNDFFKTLLIQWGGIWGKTAINAYVLITGYFMCKSQMTWRKLAKLVLEIKFYDVIFFFFFTPQITLVAIVKRMASISVNINHSFVGSFVVLYMFIPYMNKLIRTLSKAEMEHFLCLQLVVYTIIGTFLGNFAVFSHLSWYVFLYFLGAYFSVYPNQWTENKKLNRVACIILVCSAYISVLVIDLVDNKLGVGVNCYYFVANSNKILALLVSVEAFLWFKNISIKKSKWINTISSTTFGILLIHTYSDSMNTFIWNDIFQIQNLFELSYVGIVIKILISSVIVFIVCSLIDYIRISAFEVPLFKWLSKHDKNVKEIVGKVNELNRTDEKRF